MAAGGNLCGRVPINDEAGRIPDPVVEWRPIREMPKDEFDSLEAPKSSLEKVLPAWEARSSRRCFLLLSSAAFFLIATIRPSSPFPSSPLVCLLVLGVRPKLPKDLAEWCDALDRGGPRCECRKTSLSPDVTRGLAEPASRFVAALIWSTCCEIGLLVSTSARIDGRTSGLLRSRADGKRRDDDSDVPDAADIVLPPKAEERCDIVRANGS